MRKTNMWKISSIILNNERIRESQEIEDATVDPWTMHALGYQIFLQLTICVQFGFSLYGSSTCDSTSADSNSWKSYDALLFITKKKKKPLHKWTCTFHTPVVKVSTLLWEEWKQNNTTPMLAG